MSRYSNFWARYAHRGVGSSAGVNVNTVALFNGDTRYFLVVRDWAAANLTASGSIITFSTRTRLTGTAGTIAPMFSSSPILAGAIDQSSQAGAGTGDYQYIYATGASAQWNHDFPFAVIEPNYSLAWAATGSGQTILASVIYEAVPAEQIDDYLERYYNAGVPVGC